jgi:hypothetical protein
MSRRKLWVSLLIVGLGSVASAGPKGTVPRADADQYQSHAQRDGVTIAATLLNATQVRKAFVSDVNRCCVVVEVAFYPQKDKPLKVSVDDFILQASDNNDLVRPYSARSVAAMLEQKSDSGRQVTTTQTVGVGYESGTYIDPVTGAPTKVHGVTTEVGTSVAVGPPDPSTPPKNDRDAIETELAEKGLPEGSASAPVSGFVYFPASVKKKKKATLQLQYSLNDQTVVLSLP